MRELAPKSQSEIAGYSNAAKRILEPLLPSQGEFNQVITGLLQQRTSVEGTPSRTIGLSLLHEWTLGLASMGAAGRGLDISNGHSPFYLPAIATRRLVEQKVIGEKDILAEIEAGIEAAQKRFPGQPRQSKELAANRLIIKALTPEEKTRLPVFPSSEAPVHVGIQETYTRTIAGGTPNIPPVQFEVEGNYLLDVYPTRLPARGPQLYFLGERHLSPQVTIQVPHFGNWITVKRDDYLDANGISLPNPQPIRPDLLADNEKLATLLVIMRNSVT